MPSKHKLRLRRNRRRQQALFHKAEECKHEQESAKVILAEVDMLIARLVHRLGTLEKARTVTLIRALESIKT